MGLGQQFVEPAVSGISEPHLLSAVGSEPVATGPSVSKGEGLPAGASSSLDDSVSPSSWLVQLDSTVTYGFSPLAVDNIAIKVE